MEFIKRLAAINKNEKVVVVMDNLSVHKTKNVKALMNELGLEYCFTPPYHPNLNGIEYVFSQVKLKFKQLKL